ncbi:phage tail sheath family protein [Clostridium sp.]|uniref:phage tail sheath family protein n=1 Tax=Clostridium sp. TaxID=1506 RepID=UPI002621EA0A|nr:phage tail sheath family protein [Clostridium sp.]
MSYLHGISIGEVATPVATPTQSLATITIAIGTAPVNLLDDPSSAVNKPIKVTDYDGAVAAIGNSSDWDKYTLCQVTDAFFKQFAVAPVVLINVLDPAIHKSDSITATVAINNKIATIEVEGILLNNTFIVEDSTGATTYTKGTDYTVEFNDSGYPEITILSTGTILTSETELEVSYTKLDPSKVTEADIIGGYTEATGAYKGIECITKVYPMLNLVPGLLIAPGWSQKKTVEAALKAKNTLINGSFNAQVIIDIDSSAVKVFSKAAEWKSTNGYNDKREIVVWPKIKIDTKTYWYSAILAALIVYVDTQNSDVPFKSPSNKKISISSTVLADGTEVFLDQVQANTLNASGIVTAINMSGWRTWGNNTAIYPESTDPKDRWIPIRRVFDWWGNNFIVDFFDKVDDPTNYRLIESIVDEENLKANGYQAAGQIAGAKITFNDSDNSIDSILNGKIVFRQSIGAFSPAENIENILEFDSTMVSNAIFGGDN